MGSSLGRTGHESETAKVGRVRVCWTMPILPQVSQGKAEKKLLYRRLPRATSLTKGKL